ncbi:hypothetical protein CRG98_016168, partial [Punica granatum]
PNHGPRRMSGSAGSAQTEQRPLTIGIEPVKNVEILVVERNWDLKSEGVGDLANTLEIIDDDVAREVEVEVEVEAAARSKTFTTLSLSLHSGYCLRRGRGK